MCRRRLLVSVALLACLVPTAKALFCYMCESSKNSGCGINFQSFLFEPIDCGKKDIKCGLQRQLPNEDGWVGILRVCYTMGSLPGMNETNGCHNWTNPTQNFTALYCFCDTDHCNTGAALKPPSWILLIAAILYAMFVYRTG